MATDPQFEKELVNWRKQKQKQDNKNKRNKTHTNVGKRADSEYFKCFSHYLFRIDCLLFSVQYFQIQTLPYRVPIENSPPL